MRYPTKSPYEIDGYYYYAIIDGFVYEKDPRNMLYARDMVTGAIFYPKIVMDGVIEPDTEWYLDTVPIVTRKLVGHKSRVAMVPR